MVSEPHSRGDGTGSSPGQAHCVVFLGKILNCHSASLHPGVRMSTGEFNAGSNLEMDISPKHLSCFVPLKPE